MFNKVYASVLAILICCCGSPAAYANHSFPSNPEGKSSQVHVIFCYEPCMMEDVPFVTRDDLQALQDEILTGLNELRGELTILQEGVGGLSVQLGMLHGEVNALADRVDNLGGQVGVALEDSREGDGVPSEENVTMWLLTGILLVLVGLLITSVMNLLHRRNKHRQKDADASTTATTPRNEQQAHPVASPQATPTVLHSPTTNEWKPGAVRTYKVDKVDHQVTLVRTKIKDGKPVRYYATEFTHGAVAENGILEGKDLDEHLLKNRTP